MDWEFSVGFYPGFLFGFRTYIERKRVNYVVYLPLVDFCLTIPQELKINQINGLKKKFILQKTSLKFLPEKIVKRKKFPWGIPFFDFFKI